MNKPPKVDDVVRQAFCGRLAVPFLPTARIHKAADLAFASDKVLFSKIYFQNIKSSGGSLHTRASSDPSRRGRRHNLNISCQEAFCRRQEKWQEAGHCDERVSKGAWIRAQSHPQGGKPAGAVEKNLGAGQKRTFESIETTIAIGKERDFATIEM